MNNEDVIRKILTLIQYKRNQILKGKLLSSAIPNTTVQVQTDIGIQQALNLNVTNATDDCLVTKDIDTNQLVVFSLSKSNNVRNVNIINRVNKPLVENQYIYGTIITVADSTWIYSTNNIDSNKQVYLEFINYLQQISRNKTIYINSFTYKAEAYTNVYKNIVYDLLGLTSVIEINSVDELKTGGIYLSTTTYTASEVQKIKRYITTKGLNMLVSQDYAPYGNYLLQFDIKVKTEGQITIPYYWDKFYKNTINTIDTFTSTSVYGYFVKENNTFFSDDEILYTESTYNKPTALVLNVKNYLNKSYV